MLIRTFFILSLLLLFISISLNAQTDNYWEGKVKIINPGPPLNLDDIDYEPYVSQDGKYLFFSTRRKGNFKNEDGWGYSHDVWMAIKSKPGDSIFTQVLNISPPDKANSLINTFKNEGSVCISTDNKILYFTGCNRKDGYGSCDIYLALIQIENDSLFIGNIYNLGTQVNTINFESSPNISIDNLRIFYVKCENRKPIDESYQFGIYHQNQIQQDIWYSEFDTNIKAWMPGKPLSGINTKDNEMAPYICPDNKTLIFSSDGRSDSYGGLDFYYTVMDSNGDWSEPKNLGKPFNTSKDDLGISFTGDGKIAYFSSKRTDIKGKQGDYDIYMAYLSEPLFKEVRTISWQQFSDANVMIDIYDSTGNSVYTINKGLQKSGRHSFLWDGLDNKGKACTSGVYQFEVTIGNEMPEPPRVLRIK